MKQQTNPFFTVSVAGSLVGAALLHALSSAADAGWLPLIAGAIVGAELLLVVQRMFWQSRPVPTRSRR